MSENDYEEVSSVATEPSPDVYRRRRLLALAALLLVLLLLIWGIVAMVRAMSGNNNENDAATVATASSSAEPFSDFSERPSESASSSASASASASENSSASASESSDPSASATDIAAASESATPSAEPSETATPAPEETTPAVATACTAQNLNVTLSADQKTYAAGQNPALAVTYTNTAGDPCLVGGEAPQVDINITSGPAQVFNLAQCQKESTPEAELAAGATETKVITWDRKLNALGCGTNQTIKPGYYWATATVNGVASEPTRIIVTG